MSTKETTLKWSQQDKSFGPSWTDHYWQTQGLGSRKEVSRVLETIPWTSLVELGCNAGPMLEVLRKRFPEKLLGGIECNEVAVKAAQQKGLNVIHADLMTWLPEHHAKDWDVLLTHYTLAYISPQDLPAVLWQMARVAKVALVLVEPMVAPGEPEGLTYAYPEYRHNYERELGRLGFKSELYDIPREERLNRMLVTRF